MSPPKPTQHQSFETLDVQVRGLEGDVRDLKDSIAGLDAKIDKSIASLAHEVRSAVSALTGQFTERQKTPWAVLISAAGLLIVVLGGVGFQQIIPIQNDIKSIKEQIVPRDEINFRSEASNRRITTLETQIQQIANRRYEELREELRDLRRVKQ